MKKGMFFALAASSLLFSACSSDDAVLSTEGQNEAVQQIVLQVASSGDGLTTRAGRPLYSSEALQTIQHVRVLIYNTATNKIVKDEKKDWTKSLAYTNHGRQLTLTYKGNDRLEGGSYKVMAVGYSDNSDYTYALDVTGASLTGKTYSDITATLKDGKKDAEEVFAGDAALTIGADKKITKLTPGEEDGVAVTLHRQVAGSFGYFCNIPASVNGKAAATLRLVVRGKNDKLTFNNFNSSFTEAGKKGSTIKYYVNGSTSTGAPLATTDKFFNGDNGYVLYSIDLNTWFKDGDKNNDGLLNADDTWARPTTVKTQVVKGSVFGSNFVIPFNLTSGKSTMELQLLDNAGDIIKKWTVSIPELDVNKDDTKGATDESAYIFNVVRNHMYNLGVKTSTGTTTPPDPSNPDPDPDPDPKPNPDPGKDEPEDLTKSQNLILKVNDNWELIHKLELGE